MRHKKVATGSVLAMLLVLGSGCNRGWLAYQRIELGRSIKESRPLIRHKSGNDEWDFWGTSAFTQVPPFVTTDAFAVRLDAEDNIMAKRYEAVILSHWGLFQTVTVRSDMEVEVPPQPFAELPASGSSTPNPPTTLGEYLTLIEEDVSVTLTETSGEELMAFFAFGFGRALHKSMAYSIPCERPFEESDLASVLDKFPGAMNRGYDLSYRDPFGRYFRVRNLGGRRIRVEASSFRIVDPLGLALGIRLPPHTTVDAGVEQEQIKTKIEPDEGNR